MPTGNPLGCGRSTNRATYVNTFNSSIGHDACKSPRMARVSGLVPNSVAYPLHPNQAGEQNMANQVLLALGSTEPRAPSASVGAPLS